MLRSNPHAALYSQLASPYASHLYGMMPGGPNLSGLHERMKLEEEHRARIAREEEKARIAREEEKAREREREMREKEMREREQREKEMREREQREKEMRERELREKEMREREQREKELREREMREKEMREREKLLQQHHFMQRNPYNLLGLFPQMVGLRPPSSMHPGYPMHHSLLGLPLPSQIPTSLSNSLGMHHSHSPQSGSPSAPITSSASMNANMSMMSSMAMNHGMPHGMSLFPGNLPPPAHLYSPLAPPSASPSLSNSYGHPMMNPRSSPQPITRSPSSNSAQQSLNLSKNPISSSPHYSSKPQENRSSAEASKSANTSIPSNVATVSVSSIMNDKNFKIEIPNISNGNNVSKEVKSEAKDLSATKVEQQPKDGKASPAVADSKPITLDKSSPDTIKVSETIKVEEKIEKIKDENKIKAEDFTSAKEFDGKEVKTEADSKPLSSNDNKTIESEKATENSGGKEEVKEENVKVEDETNDENDESTKIIETLKTSSKK